MGWAARSNPNSTWNKKRMGNTQVPQLATQTTTKQHIQATTPARRDEPMVIELSFKTLWDKLWHKLKPRQSTSPALTS